MKLTSSEIDIPSDVLEKWQDIVDLLAEIIHVPSALVMKVEPPHIKVLISSKSEGNPYERGEVACLDTGLYCETVMKTRQLLLVPDALRDEAWKSNPDIKLGMISYMGFPVSWPDGQVFGTICVLDNKNNEYNELYRRFLLQCRDVLQADLRALAKMSAELATQKAHLNELFARAPEAIVSVDHLDRVLRANPKFENIFGYREDEVLGLPLTSLIVPEELRREAEDHGRRALHNGEILTLETVRKHKSGRQIPVSMVGVPVAREDGPSSVYWIYRDTTARRQLENDLKHERDRLRLLLNITNSMTSRLDLDQLIEALSTNLLSVMRCDHCALLLPDPDSGQLRTTVLYNPEGRGSVYNGMIVPIDDSLSGQVFRTGKSVRVDKFEHIVQGMLPHPQAGPFYERVMAEGLRSGCFFPLFSRTGVLGVLAASRRSDNAFTEDDVAFLEQVAQQVAIAIENALDYEKATQDRDKETEQKRYLQEEIRSEHNFGQIVGTSRGLINVLEQVSVVSPTDSGVMILGETGTGKELIARAIHDLSTRKERAFVKLNCAAIPLGLLESELFGHEKGAFTGAIAQKLGRFELANKGTLFLDEVGDIPLELQAKLLRVLQEQEFERLGSNRTHKVDVRIVAATHRDLAKMVKQQTFREDLYYRLKVFPIVIPPLRDRREDIPLLVRHFADLYGRRMNRKIETVPPKAMEALVRYGWPGNVRELQNFIERAVILSPGAILHAPVVELESFNPEPAIAMTGLVEAERAHILRALEASNWVVGGRKGAAIRLGLKRTSLVYKMQKLGIAPAKQADPH